MFAAQGGSYFFFKFSFLYPLPDIAGQIQGEALFQNFTSLSLQSGLGGACGLQSLRLYLTFNNQYIAVLPLLITVMLQETAEGERCV